MKRVWIDKLTTGWMLVSLVVLILVPAAMGIGLVWKSVPVLQQVPFSALFSSDWHPMQSKFGFLPFIVGSVYVTILAFVISAPVCLLASIYITQYAPAFILRVVHPIIDILAGIPSVVYGVWGFLVVVPTVEQVAQYFGVETAGYSIIAGAIVLAVMVIPYVLNLLIEVFLHIPIELQEASLSVGATRWETIKYVVLRKGRAGVFSAFTLGISKSLGETIAVLMVIGNVIQIPRSVFDAGYTIPALIANNYGEMMSIPLYDSALMLAALLLLLIVLFFNTLARYIIIKSNV